VVDIRTVLRVGSSGSAANARRNLDRFRTPRTMSVDGFFQRCPQPYPATSTESYSYHILLEIQIRSAQMTLIEFQYRLL